MPRGIGYGRRRGRAGRSRGRRRGRRSFSKRRRRVSSGPGRVGYRM